MLYIHLVSGLITDTILDLLATEDSYGEGGGLWGYILSYDNKKGLLVCLFVGCVEDHGPVIVTSLEVVSQLIHLVAPTDGCVFFKLMMASLCLFSFLVLSSCSKVAALPESQVNLLRIETTKFKPRLVSTLYLWMSIRIVPCTGATLSTPMQMQMLVIIECEWNAGIKTKQQIRAAATVAPYRKSVARPPCFRLSATWPFSYIYPCTGAITTVHVHTL